MAENDELPRANIRRIVRAKLQELQPADAKREVPIQKDALLAFTESTKVFIHYLTAMANDVCHDARRQTISGDDVLKALEDMDFGEFVEPLRDVLAALRESKKAGGAQQARKRKAEGAAGGEAGAEAAEVGAGGERDDDAGGAGEPGGEGRAGGEGEAVEAGEEPVSAGAGD